MGLHPIFYVGVIVLMFGGWMFAFSWGSKTIGRDTCWLICGVGLAMAVYGTFAGRKAQLTGSGKKMKDHYV